MSEGGAKKLSRQDKEYFNAIFLKIKTNAKKFMMNKILGF